MRRPAIHSFGGLTLVTLHPSWARVIVPPFPMTALEFLAAYPAVSAVMDGAMFAPCAGEPNNYASYQCGRVEYAILDAVTRTFNPSSYPSRGATMLVYPDDEVRVMPGADPFAWGLPWLAWQGYPRLIEQGRNIASTTRDTNRTERAGLGRLRSGELVFVSGVDSMRGFAESAVVIDIDELVYSDGGESRVVAVRERDRILADQASNLTARRVPSFVCAIDPILWRNGL